MSDVLELIAREEERELKKIGLIPSENHSSPEVLQVLSSCLSSKYSEGYPGRRHYEGNQLVDELERLAIARTKELFGVPFANVQAYSGSPANSAILFALLDPGDPLMGLKLDSGGHLTHGHPKITFSGRYFDSVQYGLDADARIDFDELSRLAREHRPKAIIAGTTAYPFELKFDRFREIADEVGAWLIADISHIAALVVAGEHPSPFPYCDVVMTTTHKTLRGPRGAVILVTERGLERDSDLGKKIDRAILPGLQGGPHNATTAAIAIATDEAMRPQFSEYARRIKRNASVLASSLLDEGLSLVGGGTENHLLLIDLSRQSARLPEPSPGLGTQVAYAMDVAGMYANRNSIPNDPSTAFYPSGVRVGSPLVTTRGMGEAEMKQIAAWIGRVVDVVGAERLPDTRSERITFLRDFKKRAKEDETLIAIRDEVAKVAGGFPLFNW